MKDYNMPIEAAIDVIGGKWKCIILCLLEPGKKRTNELRKLMPKITQKMLTQQLRELEADGLINRLTYDQIPPKVEYELNDYGKSMKPILDALCAWGGHHIDKKRNEINE